MKPFDYAFYRSVVLESLQDPSRVARPQKGTADTDLPLTDLLDELEDADSPHIDPRSLTALRPNKEKGKPGGVTAPFFDTRLHDINEAIDLVLPPRLAAWLKIRQIYDKEDKRLDFYSTEWPGVTKGGGYGIPLHAKSIHLSG